jgi:uncharacterized protein
MTPAGHSNRLATESSPYLRQHRHNPVNWYPWGKEALARARNEDKPIFLSVGYAACHWCHVMERESFEDAATAEVLNARFVAIKVDREERPDLDAVYMRAVQAMTGSGGWPLNVFLTPDLKPFFGGTYFPPTPRWGMTSFREVLRAVAEAWSTRRRELVGAATALTERLTPLREGTPPAAVNASDGSREALTRLAAEFDPDWGGFGRAPKFPSPARLFFLLEHARHDDAARTMLSRTLDGMAAGGMHDWVGGGFHRYSVDEKWLVPHFEKMLYDNALLARLYGEAGLRLGNPAWITVARAAADYLLREMRGCEGGFFSSTDADSEGHEGAYFTWRVAQVRQALPAAQAKLVIDLCGLGEKGNFEADASVLRPARPLAEVAAELELATEAAADLLAAARRGLLAARSRRIAPATDDKRLAGWNGMAVWSLAYLAAALPEPTYLAAARETATFVLAQRDHDGRLARAWREGRRSGAEALEDVAWTSAGLLQLYEADGDAACLHAARELLSTRLPHYRDRSGAFFDAPDDGPALILRPRDAFDGATPAPVGVIVTTLIRIAALTDDRALREVAEQALQAEAAALARAPASATTLLLAAGIANRAPVTLVVVGDPALDSTRQLREAAWRHKPAACTLAIAPALPVPPSLIRAVPLFAGRDAVPEGRARAYVCEGGACRLPLDDPLRLAEALAALPP